MLCLGAWRWGNGNGDEMKNIAWGWGMGMDILFWYPTLGNERSLPSTINAIPLFNHAPIFLVYWFGDKLTFLVVKCARDRFDWLIFLTARFQYVGCPTRACLSSWATCPKISCIKDWALPWIHEWKQLLEDLFCTTSP